ncbi:DUF6093 family protein [Bifidobacterium sp. ESL0745]|uniref:DUF6093 family protein n=1 Tax=Bifidobacterium sp. ESL0745 TaxID=2983226 RepID=UPI0023F851D0|nr:DUF6093 family protein [Bifidobacterium sp. ESL0745]MDF7665729.1 DUF6093 family protein [Bifidobacterium sp. ESL0745]
MLDRALPRMRANAERLMTDSFTVTRSQGEIVDPDTGVSTPKLVQVYKGKGKVQTSGGVASQANTASGESSNVGGIVPVWTLYLHFPVSATGMQPGDMAACDSSADSDLVGRKFRLVNLQSEKTYATARRWNVQEIPKNEGDDADDG